MTGAICGGGSIVFQILREERSEDVFAKVEGRVAVKFDGAQGAAIFDTLAVVPGAHDEEDLVVAGVFGLDGFVDGHRAVDVFGVPEAVDEQGGNGEGFGGEELVDGLILPEGVVARVRDDLAPEADLLQAAPLAEFAGGDRRP